MTVRLPKRQRFALGGGLAVLGVVALAGGFFAGNSRAQSSEEVTPTIPAEAETATAPPTAIATPTAFIPPPPPPVDKYTPVQLPPARPFGLVEAEPYRVFTGDGDCLNLRPTPGTTFGGDPRTCVPEGFLLWLFGPEKDVDGMTWRYALGEGWVATQYVQPAPDADRGMGPFEAVTVTQYAGDGTAVARISADGGVLEHPWIAGRTDGWNNSAMSTTRDGRWSAYTSYTNGIPMTVVLDRESGLAQEFPNLTSLGFSDEGVLLLSMMGNVSRLAWMDPRAAVVNEIPNSENLWPTWAPDGQSVVGSVDGTKVVRLFLDGTRQEVTIDLEEGAYLGELSLSPDGTKVLSASYLGDIRIIDLVTGELTVLARAPQFEGGGKCGGSTGKLSAWLDDNTVVWHESYAPRGQNGITIATVHGGIQRVIPFFSIQDLKVVAPGMISFSTWEWFDDKPEVVATWLLDTSTGEGRPVTFGGFGVWHVESR